MRQFTVTLAIGTNADVTEQQLKDALQEAVNHLRDTPMEIGAMLQFCMIHVEAVQ